MVVVFVCLYILISKVLQKFGLGKKETVTRANSVKVDVLKLTMKTDEDDVISVFKYMWEKAKVLKPAVVFYPLKLFEA